MKFARTLEKVTLHPWLITPGGYAAVTRLIESRLAAQEVAVMTEMPKQPAEPPSSPYENIAQITVSGILGQRLSWLENLCGGVDYLDIAEAIDDAIVAGAEGILFVFDSPGGMATGCPECAAKIAQVPVPKVAFTDSLMTSGAYYLASSCNCIMATPSADVGSIGVIIPWVDKSRLFDKAGLSFEPIVSQGDDLKSTMYGPSLTDEQRSYLQQSVNDVAAGFQKHVSSYRSLDFSQLKAGAYSGQRALDYNLIDKIGLIGDAYNELLGRIQKAQA